jgi:hypothetical protein
MKTTLICINTCNRSDRLKAYSYDFIKFCRENDGYDFVISLDGKDKKTIEFCQKYKIPLLYSEEREGVGISKNRVLEKFDYYDYYFFLDDDVELLNGNIFDIHIDVADKCGFYHLSSGEKCRFHGNEQFDDCSGKKIAFYDYGSGVFSFFNRNGLKKVGGLHSEFAKHKRFGHTEHTYRFVHAGLHPQAFITIDECFKEYCAWHNPPSVTSTNGIEVTKNRLARVEQDIIDQKLIFFPINTFSKYSYNKFHLDDAKIDFIKDISRLNKDVLRLEKQFSRELHKKDMEIKQCNKLILQRDRQLHKIRNSKSFRIVKLFFHTIKKLTK